ncbi:hypothetical protein Cma02nite_12040 [Cellulomonas marina]|nr:hypothetical protein Cma02nite_12040 [Cellulomonas marina]
MPAWRAWAPGTRVVVRRVRPEAAPGEPRLTDVLGDVLTSDAAGLRIRTRHGDVDVPAADVVLAKTVPPPPARRAPRAAGGDGPSGQSPPWAGG